MSIEAESLSSSETIDPRGSKEVLAALRDDYSEAVVVIYQAMLLEPEFADDDSFVLAQKAEQRVLANTPHHTLKMEGDDSRYITDVYGSMVLARVMELRVTAAYADTSPRALAEIAEVQLTDENPDKVGTLDEVPFRG